MTTSGMWGKDPTTKSKMRGKKGVESNKEQSGRKEGQGKNPSFPKAKNA